MPRLTVTVQQDGHRRAQKCRASLSERLRDLQRRLAWRRTTDSGDVPDIMREFNIGVGYRLAGRRWRYYLDSGRRLHNETVNWLSHWLGCLLMLACTLGYAWRLRRGGAADTDVGLLLMFGFSSVLLHAASAAAHLLHNRSELWHCVVFFADNAAASSCAYASNIVNVAMLSTGGYYATVAPVTLPILVFGAIFQSAAFSLALARYRRQYSAATAALMFLPSGLYILFGYGPAIDKAVRSIVFGDESRLLQQHLHLPLFLCAVLFYVSYFPERLAAGCFDIVGHSHQWFHLLVTASHWCQLHTMQRDMTDDSPELFSKRQGGFSLCSACWGLAVTLVFQAAVVLLYSKAFRYDTEFRSKRSCKDE